MVTGVFDSSKFLNSSRTSVFQCISIFGPGNPSARSRAIRLSALPLPALLILFAQTRSRCSGSLPFWDSPVSRGV